MFSTSQTVKEHIAYNEGYSAGQENAHRYYHMMFTGKQESQEPGGTMEQRQDMLGEWADKGYILQSYLDALELQYKDDKFAAYPIGTPREIIQAACQRHENRLNGVVGVPQ